MAGERRHTSRRVSSMQNLSCQKNYTPNQDTKILEHRKDFRLGLLTLWYEHDLLDYQVMWTYYKFFGGKEKTSQLFQSYCVVITTQKSEDHVLEIMLISSGREFKAEQLPVHALCGKYYDLWALRSPQILIFIFLFLNSYSLAALKISLNFINYTTTKRCPFKHLWWIKT